MAGNRRHSADQDTPSATPTTSTTVAEAETSFRLAVLNLKRRFRKGYRPTTQERQGLAKDLQKATRDLFEVTARADVPGLHTSSYPTVLRDLVERMATRAAKDWIELARHYRLVPVIRKPAKQRSRLKIAFPGDRGLPPIDDIHIADRVRKLLAPLADDFEFEFCEQARLKHQVAVSDLPECHVPGFLDTQSTESRAAQPQPGLESEQPTPRTPTHERPPEVTPTTGALPGVLLRSSSPGFQWSDVSISFLSDLRVQISTPARSETLSYGEMGFEDRRGSKSEGQPKPQKAWQVLLFLAQNDGLMKAALVTRHGHATAQKRMQELRRALRKHFQIYLDPLPYIKGKGYQAQFKITCGPSFHI